MQFSCGGGPPPTTLLCPSPTPDNDIVALLQKELDARGIPLVCRALINDTIGTLLASALQHPTCRIGAIVGTGINACYIEACAAISKDQKLFHRPQGDDMVGRPFSVEYNNNHECWSISISIAFGSRHR